MAANAGRLVGDYGMGLYIQNLRLLMGKGARAAIRNVSGLHRSANGPRILDARKPDCVYERIERLVAGPYLELFARRRRRGWYAWGNEVDKFGGDYDGIDDFGKSVDECYRVIRERKASGGKGWPE